LTVLLNDSLIHLTSFSHSHVCSRHSPGWMVFYFLSSSLSFNFSAGNAEGETTWTSIRHVEHWRNHIPSV